MAVVAVAAGMSARGGEVEGGQAVAAGATAPRPLDLVQRELARQGQVVQSLRDVVEGLDAVAEHNAAAVLLGHEGDSAERLRSALAAAQERKRRPAKTPAPVVESPAPAPAARRRLEPPLEISSAQVLYAQAGDPQRGLGGVAVLRVRTAELEVVAGQTVKAGTDRIRLVGVHRHEDGTLRLELVVNGGAVTLAYPAVSM
jgi:hypothetical protein